MQCKVAKLFTNPAHEYTHLDNRTGGKLNGLDANNNIVWMVPVVSFLAHQRSFTIGLTIFSILLFTLRKEERRGGQAKERDSPPQL